MGRRRPLFLLAAGVVITLLAWPREARLGTYGSHTLVRRGFTLAADINVGSYSEPEHEAEIFRSRKAAIDAQARPLLPLYERWFERVLVQKHPYTGRLAALDRARAAARPSDYKWRLPAPVRRATGGADPGPGALLAASPPPSPLKVYLHMRADATGLARGRALVGFVLAQLALGPSAELALESRDPRSLAERVKHAAGADSYAGQPHLIAALLMGAHAQAAEMERLAQDPGQSAETRLLARLCLIGLRHKAWASADWQKIEQARSATDRRTLWTWVLLFAEESELAAREAELRQRLPLNEDDETYFYRGFIKGSTE
ncbi:MAG: hypothetical protein U1A78_13710 [Polyangia bacterium]